MGSPIDRRAGVSTRSWVVTLLLAACLGWCGAHRFYVGKNVTGVLMALTPGGLGFWWVFDIIIVAFCLFSDKDGLMVWPGKHKG